MAQNEQGLSLRANMLWNSIGSLVYLGLQWLITVVIVRLASGFDDAGVLSLAMSVTGIFGTFANYKIGMFQISDVRGEYDLGEYLGFRIIMLIAAFVMCMVYAAFTTAMSVWFTIALYYVYKAVGLIIDIYHGNDQLHRRMDYIGKSFILQGVVSFVLFVGVYATTANLNLTLIAMTLGVIGILVFFDRRHSNSLLKPRVPITRARTLKLLRTNAPAVVASVAASALFTIPKQFLSVMGGDAALGIYASVSAPALVVQMGAMYLYSPLIDIYARFYEDEDTSGFKKLFAKTSLAILGVGVSVAVALWFLGPWILGLLFGEQILPHVYLLMPVILSTLTCAYLWFYGDLLIAIRDFNGYFWGNIISVGLVIPLGYLMVNEWGANGVSFSTAACSFAGVVFLIARMQKRLKEVS